MQQNKHWLKFIITGKPQDYLNYKDTCKKTEILDGEVYEHNNRWPCNKGNEYKG